MQCAGAGYPVCVRSVTKVLRNTVQVGTDIPVLELERASKFYAHITGGPVVPMEGAEGIALIMGTEPGGPDGDVMTVSTDLYVCGTPSAEGSTVYFSANGDIDGFLARVKEAGGTVTDEKQFIGEMAGWMAFFLDTEGNRVGVQQDG